LTNLSRPLYEAAYFFTKTCVQRTKKISILAILET